MKSDIPVVILAGGKSSRMKNGDKALLAFGGYDTLSEFQYARLSACFDRVYISTKLDKFNFKANFIKDKSEVFAPTIALLSIFEELNEDRVFLISVDTPFIMVETIKEIMAYEGEIVVAKSPNGIEPLCGIYSKSLIPKIKEMIKSDNHKLNYLIKNSDSSFIEFKNENEFLNVNRVEDYNKALILIEEWRENL